jgi:hypothetical protein
MAKIDIHIDTETNETSDLRKALLPRAANKAGLLSTISITDEQRTAFEYGFGSNNHTKRDNLGYAPNDIRKGKKQLKDDERCNVLGVTGGRAAYDAIFAEYNPTFVCLVGELPDLNDLRNCAGGISLDTWKSNADRLAYLTAKLGCNANQVGLYYNPNSGVAAHEVPEWDRINPPVAGVSRARAFSGAGGVGTAAPTNNAAQFAVDFAPAGNLFQGLRAVIISADPFFQANKNPLIQASNNWLTGAANRYICYPLQDYKNVGAAPVNRPTGTRSTLYGPDLSTAYSVLGFLAKSAVENNSVGFFTAANVIYDVP